MRPRSGGDFECAGHTKIPPAGFGTASIEVPPGFGDARRFLFSRQLGPSSLVIRLFRSRGFVCGDSLPSIGATSGGSGSDAAPDPKLVWCASVHLPERFA